MRRVDITSAKTGEKTFVFKNFLTGALTCVNAIAGERIEGTGYAHIDGGSFPSNPMTAYNVNGKKIFYCQDKFLYTLSGDTLTRFTSLSFNAPPELFTLPYRGGKGICAVHNGYGVVVGENASSFLDFPQCQGYLVHKGVLCCYNGDKVIFGGAYDYAGYTVNVSPSGFIGVENIGNILALTSDDEKVLAFGEKGVCYMYIDGDRENYRTEYPNVSFSGLARDSLKSFANTHYMIIQGGLYLLKNELKKVPTLLDNSNYTVMGNAFELDGKYMIKVQGDEEYLFVYDTLNGASYFIPTSGKTYAEQGVYADVNLNKYGRLENVVSPDCLWQSKQTDLGTEKDKTVYKITLKSNSPFTLKIESEQGVRNISTDGGIKTISLNLRGKYFSFATLPENNNFTLDRLKIFYRS